MKRFAAPLAFAMGLLLPGCYDSRREVVHDYLRSHPPAGFEVLAVPDDFTMADTGANASETVVTMRYRLTQPTVERRDLFSLPRGAGLTKRIAAVRGWALSSLPAREPTRETIIATAATIPGAFPTKHVATPRGTEISAPVILSLAREASGWKVIHQSAAVTAPGLPDDDPSVPWEDSPEVSAKLDEIETVARKLEQTRARYLADRRVAAARSRAALRSVLQTGHTFAGRLSDGSTVRLVVSQGADAGEAISTVVTLEQSGRSSARYTGRIFEEPSGEAVWRAAQARTLSSSGVNALTAANEHPILTLSAAGNGLQAGVRFDSGKAITFRLEPSESADLIPDVSAQEVDPE